MDAVFLTCCVRGMEVTRHFTPALGLTVAFMLVGALAVAGVLLILSPVLLRRGRTKIALGQMTAGPDKYGEPQT